MTSHFGGLRNFLISLLSMLLAFLFFLNILQLVAGKAFQLIVLVALILVTSPYRRFTYDEQLEVRQGVFCDSS